VNEVRKESTVASVWFDLNKDYRVVSLDDTGSRAMLARGWTERVYEGDNGNNSFDQVFSIEAWVPIGGQQTARWYIWWSAVHIGGIPDSMYIGLVESGLNQGYKNADKWIAGTTDLDKCDRDYAPERE
jgi:hypothetical protein